MIGRALRMLCDSGANNMMFPAVRKAHWPSQSQNAFCEQHILFEIPTVPRRSQGSAATAWMQLSGHQPPIGVYTSNVLDTVR